MVGLLQSANDLISTAIAGAGGCFAWFTSSLQQDPTISTIVIVFVFGAWLFHRTDLSAP